jgi:hypothetical protein
MDPLSIASSVVGITTATLLSVQLLVHTIDNIKEAPDTIKGVSDGLFAIQRVLESLIRTARDSPSPIVLNEQMKKCR